MIYLLKNPSFMDTYNPTPVNVGYMLAFYRRFYTGRYEVYRVLDQEVLSGVVGVLSCYKYDDNTWGGDTVKWGGSYTVQQKEWREMYDLKAYAVKDLKSKRVRFYVNYRVRTKTENGQGGAYITANYPVSLYIDDVTNVELAKSSFDRGAVDVFSGSTPTLDFVMDYYCKGLFTLDMFRMCEMGGMDRRIVVAFHMDNKQFLTLDTEDHLP